MTATKISTSRSSLTANHFCIVCTLSFDKPKFHKDVPQSLKSFLQLYPVESNSFSNGEEDNENKIEADVFILNQICPSCTTRLQLISQAISTIEMLRKNLDKLTKPMENFLNRDYDHDNDNYNRQDKGLNVGCGLRGNQFTFSPQKFRETLKQKLKNSCTRSEKSNGDFITVTVIPSTTNDNKALVSFQGVDHFEPNTISSIPQLSSLCSSHNSNNPSDVALPEDDFIAEEEVEYENVDDDCADDIKIETFSDDNENGNEMEISEEKNPEEIDSLYLNASVSQDIADHNHENDNIVEVTASVVTTNLLCDKEGTMIDAVNQKDYPSTGTNAISTITASVALIETKDSSKALLQIEPPKPYPEPEKFEFVEDPQVTSSSKITKIVSISNITVPTNSVPSVTSCKRKPAILANKTKTPKNLPSSMLSKLANTIPRKNKIKALSHLSESGSKERATVTPSPKSVTRRKTENGKTTRKTYANISGDPISKSKTKSKSLPASKIVKQKPAVKPKEPVTDKEADDTVEKLRCTFTDEINGRCRVVYAEQKRLDAHYNRKHLRIDRRRAFKCKQCPLGFCSLRGVVEHERCHTGEKDFLCEECGSPFRTPLLLTQHRRKAHGEPYPYNCDLCQRGFNSKCYFLQHQQTHTGDYAFKCDQCDAGFTTKRPLTDHLLTHSRIFNFLCEKCPAKFQWKGSFDVHMRIHNNDRPYICDVCGKCFLFPTKLRLHKVVHSPDKPFVCQLCGWSTRHSLSLKMHLRNHELGKIGKRKRKTESRKNEELDSVKDLKLNQKKRQKQKKKK